MSDLWNSAKEKIQDAAERVQEKAAPALESLKEKATEAKEKAAPAL